MGCGSLCVSIPTLGGPPCIDDAMQYTLEMMLAIQNETQAAGTPFGMASVDCEDM